MAWVVVVAIVVSARVVLRVAGNAFVAAPLVVVPSVVVGYRLSDSDSIRYTLAVVAEFLDNMFVVLPPAALSVVAALVVVT